MIEYQEVEQTNFEYKRLLRFQKTMNLSFPVSVAQFGGSKEKGTTLVCSFKNRYIGIKMSAAYGS
jgi:hypothetical protein